MGEEGSRRVDDLAGGAQEASVHVVPATQKPPAYYDAPGVVRKVDEEVRAGHYVSQLPPKSRRRKRALDILKSHGGHFINFYGRWAAERLEP